jgi:hypothetical protein
MMRDESDQIMDDLLSRWHSWCQGFRLSAQTMNPVFRQAKRAKGEQTLEAISEDAWLNGAMKALDFQVSEMQDPYRAAIYITARNCYTGRSVWISPRLPKDATERAAIVAQARSMLLRRLLRAGIM